MYDGLGCPACNEKSPGFNYLGNQAHNFDPKDILLNCKSCGSTRTFNSIIQYNIDNSDD